MVKKSSPDTSGAIQARIAYLLNRRAALDELILCMERYTAQQVTWRRRPLGTVRADDTAGRLAGAA